MPNQTPMLNVALHASPDFSGRILVHLKNGCVVAEQRLNERDIIGTPELFTELLERVGYRMNTQEARHV